MRHREIILLTAIIVTSVPGAADLMMSRQVFINSKSGPVIANVMAECDDIEMRDAQVNIRLHDPNSETRELLIEAEASFRMVNLEAVPVAITMGFPLSDSAYSQYELRDFRVVSEEREQSVFQRVTGYPSRRDHTWISGPSKDPQHLPDTSTPPDLFGGTRLPEPPAPPDNKSRRKRRRVKIDFDSVFGDKPRPSVGRNTSIHNLMVWREDFAPGEERTIKLSYAIVVPPQKKQILQQRIASNEKGIWEEEANNVPNHWLSTLPEGEYYFFDYFLTTGSCWAGPIGKETIQLHFSNHWNNKQVYCSRSDRLTREEHSLQYILQNEEPEEDLYFSVPAN